MVVNRVAPIFETEEQRDPSCPEQGACPCPERNIRASYRIASEAHGEPSEDLAIPPLVPTGPASFVLRSIWRAEHLATALSGRPHFEEDPILRVLQA
jgi:hypothetical protein